MAKGKPVLNSLWDGSKITLKAAKNEVIGFNLVLESIRGASGVNVMLNKIGPIASTGVNPLNWTDRPIELFVMSYLQIKGLSKLSYDVYDERHIPWRMRRPWTGNGIGTGLWTDRPDHDKFYPEIAVPAELKPRFTIAANQNQSVWVDVYVPKGTPAGIHTGEISVYENGTLTKKIPVALQVYGFTLPDVPNSKTMVYSGYGDLEERYLGVRYPNCNDPNDLASVAIRNKQFQIAHRHKIAMIEGSSSGCPTVDSPQAVWIPRLNGQLFTAANGYDGPGVGVGNGVFSVGTYGTWNWKNGVTQATMQARSGAWENWFKASSPGTERFLYLQDEPTALAYSTLNLWAGWTSGLLKGFSTVPIPAAVANIENLDITASWIAQAPTSWQVSANAWKAVGKQYWFYNGKRPATGSFATEDDGVALRQLPWAQWKKGVGRWFFWESTYYKDTQGGRGDTDVWKTAQTFGGAPTYNTGTGMSGWNSSNGDGILFYPGTDKKFPASSLGFNGPIASLRMKLWRRGIQDVDYLALAHAKNPAAVEVIVNSMVPKALWEYGVSDASDPTWVRSDISWSINPDVWETARAQLAAIIEN